MAGHSPGHLRFRFDEADPLQRSISL